MAEQKEKQYLIQNERLLSEWNWIKNTDIDPSQIVAGSGKKAWWKCSKGHEWQARIADRNYGDGCPYCYGRYAIQGENDLQTINPTLSQEWNYEKNDRLVPCSVTPNSHAKVWWKCPQGHAWQATISSRNKGNGCPYCSNKKVLIGYNDLQTVNPIIAKEWNFEKNRDLKPENLTANSSRKVWWKCPHGHEWQTTIYSRNSGSGCPYCSGLLAIKGQNDLQTINPTLAKEWNYEKNNGLTPAEVLPNSSKKIWWKCKKGHEWEAIIETRNKGNGCPFCSSGQRTSFPEYALLFYLKKTGLDVIHSYKKYGYELDIYIPSKDCAIEYDGYFWHKDKISEDLKKNKKCQKDGLTLYRIREGLPSLNDSSIDYTIQENQKDLPIILKKICFEIMGICVDVDLERDSSKIRDLREYAEKTNSLFLVNPTLANDWNHEKNGTLKPENFTANSGIKVWWKCNKGHEWKATIASRNKGNGCPHCSGRYVITGENDLSTINPSLAIEWNYEKNIGLKPEKIGANSGKKVWWICDKGHEWQAVISNRNRGIGCPYCSGRYAIKGVNDLQTSNPALAQEWNYEKNDDLMPIDVLPNSDKRVWWKCDKGHEWQATIGNRNKGRGCPVCAQIRRTK